MSPQADQTDDTAQLISAANTTGHTRQLEAAALSKRVARLQRRFHGILESLEG